MYNDFSQVGKPSVPIYEFIYHNDSKRTFDLKFSKEYLERRLWNAEANVSVTHLYIYNENESYFLTRENATKQIVDWLNKNCKGRWDRLRYQEIDFEFKEDALMFKLSFVGE